MTETIEVLAEIPVGTASAVAEGCERLAIQSLLRAGGDIETLVRTEAGDARVRWRMTRVARKAGCQ